jgi:glucokinase
MPHTENVSSRTVLGLDIGGTQMKVAIVSAEGRILQARRAPTPFALADFETTLANLVQDFHSDCSEISGVGIGCKGIVDPATTGVLALPGDLHYLEGRRLDAIVRPLMRAACTVAADNDARVALEGERRWGAARGRSQVVMLTLGTGVGGAVLVDGKILRGAGGVAGHAGHLTVDPDGPLCICGNRGCLETVFSARAIESEAFAAIHRGVATALRNPKSNPPTCDEVFECARRGDQVALGIVQRGGVILGSAIASLLHLFDPETVILGGQIAESADVLLGVIQREVDWRTKTLLRRRVPVIKSQVADPSGVLGAAALVLDAIAATA